MDTTMAITGVAGAVTTTVGGGLISLGFGSTGIAAGSIAAGIQAGMGSVAAGSLFAGIQSLGALGVFSAVGVTGGVGLIAAAIYFGAKAFIWSQMIIYIVWRFIKIFFDHIFSSLNNFFHY